MPCLGARRDVDVDGLAAPLLGDEAVLGELLADALGLRVRLVDLVDRDDDRDLGVLGVVDRLDRLRHDAVVGRDDEDDDVGRLGAAGAHRGERLVARRVEEDDVAAPRRRDVVGADVLGDAAGLARGDVGVADGVEQRGLAVVDVAHDGDHRRARQRDPPACPSTVGEDVGLLEGDVLDLEPELAGEERRGVVVDAVVEVMPVMPMLQSFLSTSVRLDAHLLGDLADGDGLVHLDDALVRGRRGDLGLLLLLAEPARFFLPCCWRRSGRAGPPRHLAALTRHPSRASRARSDRADPPGGSRCAAAAARSRGRSGRSRTGSSFFGSGSAGFGRPRGSRLRTLAGSRPDLRRAALATSRGGRRR